MTFLYHPIYPAFHLGVYQPSFVQEHVIELGALGVVRPHAEHGSHTHCVKLFVHGGGIGATGPGPDPSRPGASCSGSRRPAHRAATCGRDILGNIQRLLLGGIDGLALNVAVGRFGQQVRDAG